MRKETIVKFEKEFIAWCKGESILKGAPITMSDTKLYWEEVKDFNDWKADTIYILNDSYSIYRKALAEGKTVEVLHYTGYKEFDQNPWKLFAIGVSTFDKPVENYRIKPEELQFKVGDWVRINDLKNFEGIYKILSDKIIIEDIECYDVGFAFNVPIEFIQTWQPKEGEFIIVKSGDDSFQVTRFNPYYHFVSEVEPYIGELPSWIKDKQ